MPTVTTEWLYPTAAASVAPGDVAWTAPSNILVDDDVWSDANLLDGETTQRIQASAFPVAAAIPVGAIPVGVEVKVAGHRADDGGNLGQFVFSEAYLMIAGAIAGDNKSIGEAPGNGFDADYLYGAADDDWGIALTRDNLLDMGVSVKYLNDDGGGNDCRGYIDSIAVRITYNITIAGTASVAVDGITLPMFTVKGYGKQIS